MLVAFCLFKYFPYGGLQRDFMRIAQEVENRGHQVRIYVADWQGEKPDTFDIVHVPISAPTNHGRGLQYTTWVLNHLKQKPCDIVVGFNRMPGLDVYYGADVCYEQKVSQEKTGLYGFFYRLMSRYKHFANYERAVFSRGQKTKLLMISEKEIQNYKKHYDTEPERFVLLPPGISKDRMRGDITEAKVRELRSQLGVSEEQIVLLQVGSNYKLKGVDRSLKAIASLPEALKDKVLLLVVGQDKADIVHSEAASLNLSDKVRVLGARDDVSNIMVASDIFLHPAYRENTGTVILEAIIAGLPAIVSGTCGYAHYVKEANCGEVVEEPFSQEVFNRALLHFVQDRELRLRCCENGIKFSKEANIYSMITQAVDAILSVRVNQ